MRNVQIAMVAMAFLAGCATQKRPQAIRPIPAAIVRLPRALPLPTRVTTTPSFGVPGPERDLLLSWDQNFKEGGAVPLPYGMDVKETNGWVRKILKFDIECKTNLQSQWTLFGRTNVNHLLVPGNLPVAYWRVGWHLE